MGYVVASADLVLSSKIESLVADIQDRDALRIIKQEFPVPSSNDSHIQLVV